MKQKCLTLILLLTVLVIPVSCSDDDNLEPVALTDFNEVKNSIKSGEQLVVVTDLAKCGFPQNLTGRMVMNDVIINNDEYLTFSLSHLTANNPAYPGKAIIENLHYRLFNDGTFEVTIKYIDPDTSEVIYEYEGDIICRINEGVKIFSNL